MNIEINFKFLKRIFYNMIETGNLLMQELEQMDKLTLNNYMNVIREDLISFLEINDLSEEAFAKRANVSGRIVRYIKEGRTDDISLSTWIKIKTAMFQDTYTSRTEKK